MNYFHCHHFIYGEKETVIQQSIHHTMLLTFSLMNRGVAVFMCPDLSFLFIFSVAQFDFCFFVCTCVFVMFVSFFHLFLDIC